MENIKVNKSINFEGHLNMMGENFANHRDENQQSLIYKLWGDHCYSCVITILLLK